MKIKNNTIFSPRLAFMPFEYDKYHKFYEEQLSGFWSYKKIDMAKDQLDWNTKLSSLEKNVIGNILKGFTQSEVVINNYWIQVSKWFPKAEINGMAIKFAEVEVLHANAYALLNTTLNLLDFAGFMDDPATKAKLDAMTDIELSIMPTNIKNISKIAKSLAIFSAFNEGVNLFASFAILFSFSQAKDNSKLSDTDSKEDNLMNGVREIVLYSSRDESKHSDAGCSLFIDVVSQFPEIKTNEFIADIYEAAKNIFVLESNFIDKVFEMGEIPQISSNVLKKYIQYRIDDRLAAIGFSPMFGIKFEEIKAMETFHYEVSGRKFGDFFNRMPVEYAKVDASNWQDDKLIESFN
jgi:ribonucleoside-diphosphate reductase beta chain